jgi:hypothetical protein
MTKIRTDTHGVYVRAGGYVFRPVATVYSYMPGTTDHGVTSFGPSDSVRARHIAGTGRGRLRGPDREEIWHSHGCYYDRDGKIIPSDRLWMPD